MNRVQRAVAWLFRIRWLPPPPPYPDPYGLRALTAALYQHPFQEGVAALREAHSVISLCVARNRWYSMDGQRALAEVE